jgi:GIY-YIG catalytic domain
MSALLDAAERAPDAAGVYFFLDAPGELLYAGKASNLRKRLTQHARAQRGRGGVRLDVLYQRVTDVRWEPEPDEAAAAAREADVIVALRPVFNASIAGEGRWNYVVVEPGERDPSSFHFVLSPAERGTAGRAYGCFPHLGRGVSSAPGIVCSDGYTALLRLLWTAGATERAHVPARITRAAPDAFEVRVDPSRQKALHQFLSGTSNKLLAVVAAAGTARAPHLAPALARDRTLAASFFRYGPAAIRRLRLRHGQAAGTLTRAQIEAFVTADLRGAIGDFVLPRPAEATDAMLGRRAHRWARS